MPRKPRVVIPVNPGELMKLTSLVFTKHQALGTKSPLLALAEPTWDEMGPAVTEAVATQARIEELEKELKMLYGRRDPHLVAFTDLDRRSRDLLLAIYAAKPRHPRRVWLRGNRSGSPRARRQEGGQKNHCGLAPAPVGQRAPAFAAGAFLLALAPLARAGPHPVLLPKATGRGKANLPIVHSGRPSTRAIRRKPFRLSKRLYLLDSHFRAALRGGFLYRYYGLYYLFIRRLLDLEGRRLRL